jgi:hypothetical protein
VTIGSLVLGVSVLVTLPVISAHAFPTSARQKAFRTGVTLLTIDVQITPSNSAPLREFKATDFDVSISGRRRPVASAAFLHLDEGSVIRNPPRLGSGADAGCIFGFHRKTDRPTAHYLLGIQPAETDREAREVRVKTADSAFSTQWSAWRVSIR